jgi:large subunit ribosomal protein L9
MKILLIKDVKDLGRKGEVKEVSAGYARNFLVLRKLAVPATANIVARAEAEIAQAAERRAKLLVELKVQAKELANAKLTFVRKVGEKGDIFGSVTGSDIEAALRKQGFVHGTVDLKHHLKTIGTHTVTVDLGEGITTNLEVAVLGEEQK